MPKFQIRATRPGGYWPIACRCNCADTGSGIRANSPGFYVSRDSPSSRPERLSAKGLPEDTAALVEDLREGIRRNRRLLEQLLSMARAQAHENHATQNINLSKFCQRLVQDLYPLAASKNIDLGADCESTEICVDETEIYTLIKTLLENAILYTPENGRVDLTAKIENRGLRIEIEDNGPGIPPEERDRVFDPFYRVLGTGTEGSGLGLSIAKTIAERYGGTISLSDSPNFKHGLKVSIWLPQEGVGCGC